jgi:hypothetical protein
MRKQKAQVPEITWAFRGLDWNGRARVRLLITA